MSISFYGNELINIAIGIERRGVDFYDVMARSTQNATAREIFQYLAGVERGHIQTFRDMLTEAEIHESPEVYAGEYAAYLQALVDSAVFTDDMTTSEMAAQAESDVRAIELGIMAEKDSILFYYGMRERMPQGVHPTLNKVIAKEELHLKKLSDFKKQLTE